MVAAESGPLNSICRGKRGSDETKLRGKGRLDVRTSARSSSRDLPTQPQSVRPLLSRMRSATTALKWWSPSRDGTKPCPPNPALSRPTSSPIRFESTRSILFKKQPRVSFSRIRQQVVSLILVRYRWTSKKFQKFSPPVLRSSSEYDSRKKDTFPVRSGRYERTKERPVCGPGHCRR